MISESEAVPVPRIRDTYTASAFNCLFQYLCPLDLLVMLSHSIVSVYVS